MSRNRQNVGNIGIAGNDISGVRTINGQPYPPSGGGGGGGGDLPNGTQNNSTLRWNEIAQEWQENTTVLANDEGNITTSTVNGEIVPKLSLLPVPPSLITPTITDATGWSEGPTAALLRGYSVVTSNGSAGRVVHGVIAAVAFLGDKLGEGANPSLSFDLTPFLGDGPALTGLNGTVAFFPQLYYDDGTYENGNRMIVVNSENITSITFAGSPASDEKWIFPIPFMAVIGPAPDE